MSWKDKDKKSSHRSEDFDDGYSFWNDWDDDEDENKTDEPEDIATASSWGWGWGGKRKEVGKSVSSSWASRFSLYGTSYKGMYSSCKSDKEKYSKALRSIRRSANIALNNSVNEDEIVVKWSDGKDENLVQSKIVYLSPDILDKGNNKKIDWTNDELNDVLVGQVLTESSMKRTADKNGEKKILTIGDLKISECANPIWHTAETFAAQKDVAKEFPGFIPYISSMIEYHTDEKSFKDLQETLTVDQIDLKNYRNAVIWSMLHPESPLEIPETYEGLVEETVKNLKNANSSIDRAEQSIYFTKKMSALIPSLPESENQSGEGNNIKPSELGMPRDHYGEAEENDTDEQLAKMDADSTETDGGYSKNEEYEEIDGINEVKVKPPSSDLSYKNRVQNLHPAIHALKNRIKIKEEDQSIYEVGLRRGQLDEGNLHKIALYSSMKDDRVFMDKEVPGNQKIAFSILVDESGSMQENVRTESGERTTRMELAKNAAIIITNVLNDISEVEVSVLGHTAQGSGADDTIANGLSMHQYFTPENSHIQNLIKINHYTQNLDGYAIRYTKNKMNEWYSDDHDKIIIHISDGYPEGYDYGGTQAVRHVSKEVEKARRSGVKVIGICCGEAFNDGEKWLQIMYGTGNYITVSDMTKASCAIGNLITKIIFESKRI